MVVNKPDMHPGLESFMEEAHELFDRLSRETHPETTQHHNVSILVDDVLREPNDENMAHNPNFIR